MVSSNKILTVSYGTFSCTLEGFDNSFDTMKAIAEYFRDLAQDDRYFGAEPPTPDAEMLARIAEREIERRVEARFEKGNLVLRQTDEAEPPHGDVAPEPSSDAALVNATVGAAATALAVAGTEAAHDQDETSGEIALATDAKETLVDIEAADHEAETLHDIDLGDLDLGAPDEDELDLDDVDLGELDLGEESAVSASDVLSAEDDTPAESSIDDLIIEQGVKADRTAKAEADDKRAASEAAEDELLHRVATAPVVADTVADKLQRIRAVVASKAQSTPEYIEDEHAMSGADGDGHDENDAIDSEQDIPGFVEADASHAETEDDADDNLFIDTIAAALNDEIEPDTTEDAVRAENADTFDDEDETQSELDALRAKIAALEAQAAAAAATAREPAIADKDAAAIAELYDDEDDVDAEQDSDAPLILESFADDEDDVDDEDDTAPLVLETEILESDDDLDDTYSAEDARTPLVARVSKAKRSDVEKALASGEIEAYDDDEDDVEPASLTDQKDSTLTAEQEAELARELAELHAEIEEDDDWNFDDDEDDDTPLLSEDDEQSAQANIRKAVKLTSPGRAMLTDTSIEEDDDSVDRLADKTETEMDEPEGNRRRSAIAHLRAAVAATKAERLLGFGRKKVDEEEPYREDLADAVRPRRPKVTQARSERPAPVRPAPLKLVAEQRIDAGDTLREVSAVRPRRVIRSADAAASTDSTATDETGFAEFAERQGANTLSELLEAAAAYMSFVEGRDQFSRPQLMTKLVQAEGEASSREERLRSFGQLLREGKIEKKGGGRFAASDNIGFKPDTRAAG